MKGRRFSAFSMNTPILMRSPENLDPSASIQTFQDNFRAPTIGAEANLHPSAVLCPEIPPLLQPKPHFLRKPLQNRAAPSFLDFPDVMQLQIPINHREIPSPIFFIYAT